MLYGVALRCTFVFVTCLAKAPLCITEFIYICAFTGGCAAVPKLGSTDLDLWRHECKDYSVSRLH